MIKKMWIKWVTIALFALYLAAMIYIMLTSQSEAQSADTHQHSQIPHDLSNPGHWYPSECCSLQDCYPLSKGDVVEEDGGYRIRSTGELFPYTGSKGVRMSQDGYFHRCPAGGNKLFSTLIKSDKACLFVPQGGV